MDNRFRSSQLKSGFTLIELLVVISIIALLLSVLLPALAKAREQAKVVICKSQDKQMGMAIAMWIEDNKGYMPAWQTQGQQFITPKEQYLSSWPFQIAPYMSDAGNDPKKAHKVFTCPSAPKLEADVDEGIKCGYGLNFPNVFCTLPPKDCPSPRKLLDFKRPGQTAAGMDSEGLRAPGKGLPFVYMAVFNPSVREKTLWWAWNNAVPYNRHSKGVNVFFLDWHVEWRKREDIMKVSSSGEINRLWGDRPEANHWH